MKAPHSYTRDIYLKSVTPIGKGVFLGIDMLAGEQITIKLDNPRCGVISAPPGSTIRADRCAQTGFSQYSANWIRVLSSAQSSVRLAPLATLDIYSTGQNRNQLLQSPEEISAVLRSGDQVRAIATILKPEETRCVDSWADLTKQLLSHRSQVKTASFSVVDILYDSQTNDTYRFVHPYVDGSNMEAAIVATKAAIEGDRSLHAWLNEKQPGGVGRLSVVPGVALNMSELSLKNYLTNTLLKPATGVSRTGNIYPMGSWLMATLSCGNYAPCAAVVNKSTEGAYYYLAELCPIGTKTMTWSLPEAIKNHQQKTLNGSNPPVFT